MNILITGGVGFIGTNCALSFAQQPNTHITIVDNFSRPGVERNARYLTAHIKNLQIIQADINDTDKYTEVVRSADVILHLAGQTAVTTSLQDPQWDFEANVQGSFRLLELVRAQNPQAILLYSSTNKVYGDLHSNKTEKKEKEKIYHNLTHPDGIDETAALDFISPYGCSKGAIDLYVQDYTHSFGLRTAVFRQSCIYGPFQIGVEDQGWVAHFGKQVLTKQPITIFGDGYQVRDLLYVEDLVDVYKRTIQQIDEVKGTAFNIGGGTGNSYSLHQVLEILHKQTGNPPQVDYQPERMGDQKYFVSANTRVRDLLGWEPTTPFPTGITRMLDWQREHVVG